MPDFIILIWALAIICVLVLAFTAFMECVDIWRSRK